MSPAADRQLIAEGVGVVRQGRSIVRHVSLAASPGRLLALVGPNGAGKSTLLSVLAGRVRPDTGYVRLDGVSLTAWDPRALARRRAMLSQRVDLAFGFTAREVVLLGRSPHAPDAVRDEAIATAALRAAHAWELRDRRYTALSGGEQQRVQLARVLAQVWGGGPEGAWLLLDEPEAGLDIAHQHFILRRARVCAALGLGVIAVLHDLNLAARYADEVAVLASGALLRHGPPAEALDTSLLSEIYGIPLGRSVGIDVA
ncbi:MAG TPA: heme ABC transporter ATP-binding protein [Luteibacter sp.]|jgi:iron complex transport system ATP-binding protein|uniref:heme ABC transporter ATP-binding protein n=1 Tax=Luteibacter sp. TaxID=1886636 RepID=UPI002F3FFC3B